MVDGIKAGQPDNDEIDRDDEIEEPRHQKDEDTGNKRDKRRDMGGGNDHEILFSFCGCEKIGKVQATHFKRAKRRSVLCDRRT